MPELRLPELRKRLRAESNGLVDFVFDVLSPRLIPCEPKASSGPEKVVNDPIWKISVVGPSVLPLMELPLLQRLRRVRQLGLAHLVYPGAHHSRFEHSLGSMRAAERMFDALAASGNMPSDYQRQLRKVLTSAAILHDAGHTAFSHVGERVLQHALRDEYEAVVAILRQAFPDSLESVSTGPTVAPERHKLPAAAELMSALFVLSPSMEKIVPSLQHEFPPDECIMMMCGFILGRPRNLRNGDIHYYWAKGIISGDLDCDKVDYVARDAYYAGIPTATDIDRLLSQLVAIKARYDISAPDLHYSFGRGNPTELQLFGIRPTGASALEMLS
jgi:deoxynucleoside triphosphate triphosphohydrolase SAMHD1